MGDSRINKTRNDLLISFGSQFFYKAIAFATVALVARSLTKNEFGRLMFAMALCGIAIHFTGLGTRSYLIREVAADPSNGLIRLAEVLALRLPLYVAFFVLLVAGAWLFDPVLLAVIAAISIYMVLKDAYSAFGALFIGLRRIGYTVVVFGAGQMLLGVGAGLGAYYTGNLRVVLVGYVVAGVGLVGLAAILTQWKVGRFRFVRSIHRPIQVARASWPLFVITLLEFAHLKIDTLMLALLDSFALVATYEAAAKFLEASQFLIRPISLIFFPICAQLAAQRNWTGFKHTAPRVVLSAVGLGAALAALMWVAAPYVIPLAFGDGFLDSEPVLRWVYLSVPALFLTTVALFFATSLHLERRAAVVLGIGVAANIILNSWLIPTHGALGAAWATVISQSAMAVGVCGVAFHGLASPERLNMPATAVDDDTTYSSNE